MPDPIRLRLNEPSKMVATTVGVGHGRALHAFYGLSRAGRAIAVAARTGRDVDWKLNGHGIRATLS